MRIKMLEDHAADRMYWCGQFYEVDDVLAAAWVRGGIAIEDKPLPRRRRKAEEVTEEDE